MNTAAPGPCDTGIAAAARPGHVLHPTAILAATILGSSVALIDGSVVNVALPAMQADLGASGSTLAWTINAYLLPLGALTLLGGGASDRFGRRRLFLIGLALFTAASILCAVAPTYAWLLLGRVLQGLGAALLLPSSLAILGTSFDGAARGRAIGTWAAAGALAGSVAPVLGGWLVDVVGWRPIFLLNAPIALAGGYLAWRYIDPYDGDGAGPLDWLGAGVATLGLLLLTWALTVASGDGITGVVGVAGLVGVGLLAWFVWIEHGRGERAVMPLGLFATSGFAGLTLFTFFLYASFGGLLVLLPFLLIRVAGYSATAAGAAILPLPIVIGLGSRLMGRLTDRYGGRRLLVIGAGMATCGFALYLRITGAIDYWTDIFPPTLLVAIGMGISVAPLTTSVMAEVDRGHAGAASGFNSAVARIAGLVATALLGYVWASEDSGTVLLSGFHVAALVGAVSAALAAASAGLLMRGASTE